MGAIETERLRILECLHHDVWHDLVSPLGLIRASLGMLESLADGLTLRAAHLEATEAGGPDGAAARPGSPGLGLERAQSDSLDFLLQHFGSVVGGAQSQTGRALRVAEALVTLCAGDRSSNSTDVNLIVERGLALVGGRLQLKRRVESRFAVLPQASLPARDLLHAVVVALLQAAAVAPEQTAVVVSTAQADGGLAIEVCAAAGGGSAPADLPDLAISAQLIEAGGGSLRAVEAGDERRWLFWLPSAHLHCAQAQV